MESSEAVLIEYNSLVVKRVVRLVTIPTTAATNSCRFSLDDKEMDFIVSNHFLVSGGRSTKLNVSMSC